MLKEVSSNSCLHYLSLVNLGLTLDEDRTVLAELPADIATCQPCE